MADEREMNLDNEFSRLQQEYAQGTEQPNGGNQFPEKIGDMPLEAFEKVLGEASGGKFQNYSAFQEALTLKEKFEQLNQEFSTLKTKEQEYMGGPKYSNDLVKKIDEMYRSGMSEAQINDFITLQRMDVQAMSDKEVMLQVYKRQYPEFSDDELNQLVDDELGSEGLKLKKAAVEGRKTLNELKVNIGEPTHIREQKAKMEAMGKTMQSWHQVFGSTTGSKEVLPIKLKIGDEDRALNFNVPKETRERLSLEVAKFAAQEGIPPTKEGMEKLNNFYEQLIMFKHGKEIMATFVRDVEAQTKQKLLLAVHNLAPTRTGNEGKENGRVLTEQDKFNQNLANEYWR